MNKVITSEKIPIKLWLDDIEEGALTQAKNLANFPFAYKWIAIMPDSHQGFGMPIGGVMATEGVIVPNAVGVDIGCGMMAVKTSFRSEHMTKQMLNKIVAKVKRDVPVGFNHHDEQQHWEGFDRAPNIPIIMRQLDSARFQLGTLGGGNHFIEVQEDRSGFVWLMIHSGSRNFGYRTAKVYHETAKELCLRWASDVPHLDLSFLPLDYWAGEEYYEAMSYCVEFALANRQAMMSRVKDAVSRVVHSVYNERVEFQEPINIAHNYAALEHHLGKNVLVHRKGATRARNLELGIIPGSMGTPSYIVMGKGSKESFKSCSHGAGRRMGRKEARRSLDLAVEQEKMSDVISGLDDTSRLDEAPGAYKDISVVMENQRDLVDIVTELHPLANVKG